MKGNPVAVVVDSDGLSGQEMLDLTGWLNLSETTFIVPPTDERADYQVRIFTLSGELPFAGHPTLGTCHVWLEIADTGADEIIQECGAGLVPLRRSDGYLSFRAPPLQRSGPVEGAQLAVFADVLGLDTSEIIASNWVDNGPGWVGLQVGDAETVLRLEPDFSRHPRPRDLDIGVFGFHGPGSETLYEVRAFFSDQHGRMREDPVTGSLNASLAQWLITSGHVTPPYVASQGTALGRAGRAHISQDESGSVWVGGRTATIVVGAVDL